MEVRCGGCDKGKIARNIRKMRNRKGIWKVRNRKCIRKVRNRNGR